LDIARDLDKAIKSAQAAVGGKQLTEEMSRDPDKLVAWVFSLSEWSKRNPNLGLAMLKNVVTSLILAPGLRDDAAAAVDEKSLWDVFKKRVPIKMRMGKDAFRANIRQFSGVDDLRDKLLRQSFLVDGVTEQDIIDAMAANLKFVLTELNRKWDIWVLTKRLPTHLPELVDFLRMRLDGDMETRMRQHGASYVPLQTIHNVNTIGAVDAQSGLPTLAAPAPAAAPQPPAAVPADSTVNYTQGQYGYNPYGGKKPRNKRGQRGSGRGRGRGGFNYNSVPHQANQNNNHQNNQWGKKKNKKRQYDQSGNKNWDPNHVKGQKHGNSNSSGQQKKQKPNNHGQSGN
jgi:hypothetical protein